jgi:hypothetical protein
MKNYCFGIVWDNYTPAVEGQIVRDIIALQQLPRCNLMVAVLNGAANRTLEALRVQPCPLQSLADLWIVYRTGPEHVEPPEHAVTVIERDLYQETTDRGGLSDADHGGYFLAPQGRPGRSSSLINRPPPNHSGMTDPIVLYLWGN